MAEHSIAKLEQRIVLAEKTAREAEIVAIVALKHVLRLRRRKSLAEGFWDLMSSASRSRRASSAVCAPCPSLEA